MPDTAHDAQMRKKKGKARETSYVFVRCKRAHDHSCMDTAPAQSSHKAGAATLEPLDIVLLGLDLAIVTLFVRLVHLVSEPGNNEHDNRNDNRGDDDRLGVVRVRV